MANSDFVRQISAGDGINVGGKNTLLTKLHIDLQLLVLLLLISGGGLFVLYSGSGGEEKYQATVIGTTSLTSSEG